MSETPPSFEQFSEEGEPLLPREEQEELNRLRRKSYEGGRENLSKEEWDRLQELLAKEEKARRERYGSA